MPRFLYSALAMKRFWLFSTLSYRESQYKKLGLSKIWIESREPGGTMEKSLEKIFRTIFNHWLVFIVLFLVSGMLVLLTQIFWSLAISFHQYWALPVLLLCLYLYFNKKPAKELKEPKFIVFTDNEPVAFCEKLSVYSLSSSSSE